MQRRKSAITYQHELTEVIKIYILSAATATLRIVLRFWFLYLILMLKRGINYSWALKVFNPSSGNIWLFFLFNIIFHWFMKCCVFAIILFSKLIVFDLFRIPHYSNTIMVFLHTSFFGLILELNLVLKYVKKIFLPVWNLKFVKIGEYYF